MNGYNVFVSNQIQSDLTEGASTALSAMIFGNFDDLMIGMWGGLDVLIDPYTGGTAGTVRIIVLQDIDIKLRHNESFSKIVDMITV